MSGTEALFETFREGERTWEQTDGGVSKSNPLWEEPF